MARNIALDQDEAWRAVIVHKYRDGTVEYEYRGIYNKEGTAKQQVSNARNNDWSFYDGWWERAEIIWHRVKD